MLSASPLEEIECHLIPLISEETFVLGFSIKFALFDLIFLNNSCLSF